MNNMKKVISFSAFLVMWLPTIVSGQTNNNDPTSSIPTLESIEGATSLTVTNQNGETRQAMAGEQIQIGDTLATGSDLAIRISYNSGSEILVGLNSQITIQDDNTTPVIELQNGEIRSMIAKAPQQNPNIPHSFLIRTRSAMIGVRGTDFTVLQGPDDSEIHTLSGLVDVGNDREALRTGNSESISPGYFTHVRPGQRAEKSKKFVIAQFLNEFHKRHPRLAKLANQINNEKKNGHKPIRIRPPQKQVHQHHTEQKIKEESKRIRPERHEHRRR
jgi:hypothetical protein